ncbi:MAG: C-terminal helicase domain-containing protein, partial [archaeon]|nr:C-terminal helicase domain-containing protein [archaeon]
DMVHEYLLIKGVEAVAIHGGLFQDERDEAIVKFRKGEADVLVATDVVSKGLDFQGIEHVVNFDMPDTIENYVHRIGRTGRFGSHGVATTYVNSSQSETILLDLKHLLTEASQRIPQFLLDLQGSEYAKMSIGGIVGCAFCGGSGHRVSRCDRLEKHQRQLMGQLSRASDSNM